MYLLHLSKLQEDLVILSPVKSGINKENK